jgi:DNA-binding MarR family transcriptional regulator/SAM-dependent methyltransferase
MLSKQQKAEYREELFRHLDGMAVAPTAYCLYKNGVLDFLGNKKEVSLIQIIEDFDCNEGYMNVALRVLSSQGWLNHVVDNVNDKVRINLTERGKKAIELIPLYEEIDHLMKISGNYHPRRFDKRPFQVMEKIYDHYGERYGLESPTDDLEKEVQGQVLKHIEGVLVGPTVVLLGMGGMFHKYFMEASFRPDEYHEDPESFGRMLDFFSSLNWFKKKGKTYQFTDKGLFFAKRSSAYGVTVSYIPTFRKLDDLIFGDPYILRNVKPGEKELHVDREMNVWGSGGAHSAYFKKVDEIIIDIFNKPIDDQPKGILDMGCGNGAFLIHLFEIIEQRTKRGEMLEEHPLFLVGVDYNETALRVTRKNLIQADIWAKVIWGDISNPALLEKDLQQDYDINLKDLLNVRTFLDHNRIWSDPEVVELEKHSESTGAFSHRGKRLNNDLVEKNLKLHLLKWKPYVHNHGLIVIELHTIPSELTSQNIGRTAATAYDATHGFSDQYIVEIDVFNKIANEVGLYNDERFFAKFPNSDLATVSINYLKG